MISASSASISQAASALYLLQSAQSSASGGAAAPSPALSQLKVGSGTLSGNTLFAILQAASKQHASAGNNDATAHTEAASDPSAKQAGAVTSDESAEPWYVSDPYLLKKYDLKGAIDNVYAITKMALDEGQDWNMSPSDYASFKTAVDNRSLTFTSLDDVPGANYAFSIKLNRDSEGNIWGMSEGDSYDSSAVNKYTNGSTRAMVGPAYGYTGVSGFLLTW